MSLLKFPDSIPSQKKIIERNEKIISAQIEKIEKGLQDHLNKPEAKSNEAISDTGTT